MITHSFLSSSRFCTGKKINKFNSGCNNVLHDSTEQNPDDLPEGLSGIN
jgi:hypothetical protein